MGTVALNRGKDNGAVHGGTRLPCVPSYSLLSSQLSIGGIGAVSCLAQSILPMRATVRVIVALFAVLWLQQELAAQRANNLWYFGDSAAIDFNSSPPRSRIDSRMSAPEGSASIADRRTGALLFYTNGEQIWNRSHEVMINGDALEGHRSSLQSSVIVPDPADDYRYHLFTTDASETGFRFGLQYSIVDMRGDGGNGHVVVRNQTVVVPVGERLCAVRSCGEDRFWVITYVGASHEFVAVPVTAAGVGAPVVSIMGESEFGVGEIKASNGGELLVTSVKLSPSWDSEWAIRIYSLDHALGTVSVVTTIGRAASAGPYAFSPDDTKLYVSGPSLLQYDVSVLDSTAITDTRTVVFEAGDAILQGMQVGPDGRVYVSVRGQPFVGVVQFPNISGTACAFELNGVALDRGSCRFQLPNTIAALNSSDADAGEDLSICRGDSVRLRGSGGSRMTWSPATSLSCADCAEPVAFPTTTTTYRLSVSDGRGCVSTDSVTVRVLEKPTADAGDDAWLCAGDSAILRASGASSYVWRPERGLSCVDCAMPTARPSATTTYVVRVINEAGCWDEDSVTVTVADRPVASAGGDTSICRGSTLVLNGSDGVRWQWSPPDGLSCVDCQSPSIIVDSTIAYRLVVTSAGGCTDSDTIVISALPAPTIHVTGDTVVCPGATVSLHASGAVRFRWEPREGLSCVECSDPSATPRVTTTYYVEGRGSTGCTTIDSLTVRVLDAPAITLVDSVMICSGTATVLTASGAPSFVWWPPLGLSCSDCSSPTASPDISTTYRVIGVLDGGCSDTAFVFVEVVDEIDVRASLPRDLSLVAGVPTRVAVVIDRPFVADSVHIELAWHSPMIRADGFTVPDALTRKGWTLATRISERGRYAATLINSTVAMLDSGEVLVMTATAFLADSLTSELILRVTANDDCAHISSVDGRVRLDSVCGLAMRLIQTSSNGLELYAPVPNPASGYLRIPFEIPFDGHVEIALTDVGGKASFTLHSGEARRGRHELTFDASSLATGAYRVRLRFGDETRQQPLVIVD